MSGTFAAKTALRAFGPGITTKEIS